jgi:hypothetical protein
MTPTPRTDAECFVNEGPFVTADFARQLETELAEATAWKNTVIDDLVCCHIYREEHDNDPKKAFKDAINWNVFVALDPVVSKEASDLVRTARADAFEEAAETAQTFGDWEYSPLLHAQAAAIRKGEL